MVIVLIVVGALAVFVALAISPIFWLPPTRPRGSGLGGYFVAPMMNTPLDDVRGWKRYRDGMRQTARAISSPVRRRPQPTAPEAHTDEQSTEHPPHHRTAHHRHHWR